MKSQETEVAPRFIVSQGLEVVPGLMVLVRAGGRPAAKGVPGARAFTAAGGGPRLVAFPGLLVFPGA